MVHKTANRKTQWFIILAVGLTSLIIYWLTAYRSITWWVGTSYTMTAITLGNNFPPGSLITTLLGWFFSLLPLGLSKAFIMNLLAGLITVITVIMTMILSLNVFGLSKNRSDSKKRGPSYSTILLASAIGGLLFAFSETVWTYSIQYTPYVLTALFTVLILMAMLKWWEKAEDKIAVRLLFLIFLMVGLDFCVHRTNLLLLPGILIWILFRYPKTFIRLKSWLVGISGLILGGLFHLLTIPLAAAQPLVNANDPSNLTRFYDYISLKQYGGGWLVNLFPRKAPFFNSQLADYIDYFKINLINIDGTLGIFSILVPILILTGIILLWRQNWKLCLGLIIQFLCLSLLAVFYFNTPENFYWPMDRHYIPSYIIMIIFMTCALGVIFNYITNNFTKNRAVIISVLLLLMAIIPLNQILGNYSRLDGSKRHFAYDYAHNILTTLPENSILFINGDNYWPILYYNKLEDVRPDVTVISQSLINTQWYLRQIMNENPNFPIRFTDEEISVFSARSWQDTTISISVSGQVSSFELPPETVIPDTFYLNVKPTVSNVAIMGQDVFMLRLLQEDRWQRPIYFNNPPPWLKKHCRNEGLVWRCLPLAKPETNVDLLQHNLLRHYSYRGFADPGITFNRLDRFITDSYYLSFLDLIYYYFTFGDIVNAESLLDKMYEILPIEKGGASERTQKIIEQIKSALKEDPQTPDEET